MQLLKREEALGLLLEEEVHFFVEVSDFELGLEVHFVVVLAAGAVLGLLAVLTHHDYGGLNRGETREEEVEKDEGIRVRGPRADDDVQKNPDEKESPEDADEAPTAAESRDEVGPDLAAGEFCTLSLANSKRGQAVGGTKRREVFL